MTWDHRSVTGQTRRRARSAVDPLAEAARAYAEARQAHSDAQKALADATAALKAAREPLATEIVKAARSGASQREIHNRTGDVWTRENIRKVCRAAGVDLRPTSGAA
jgi:hypothetical protein